jgi:hypothetical protein
MLGPVRFWSSLGDAIVTPQASAAFDLHIFSIWTVKQITPVWSTPPWSCISMEPSMPLLLLLWPVVNASRCPLKCCRQDDSHGRKGTLNVMSEHCTVFQSCSSSPFGAHDGG